jgi:hypothetical protein
MLSVNKYPKAYVAACRQRMADQLAAYDAMKAGAGKAQAARFEPLFVGNLILALDASFVHRTRGLEGKDGNPLNEVRMWCTWLLQHDGIMTADKTCKYDPPKAVLKGKSGDAIALSATDFKRLASPFCDEIGARFV